MKTVNVLQLQQKLARRPQATVAMPVWFDAIDALHFNITVPGTRERVKT
jgi:hypothetical protein